METPTNNTQWPELSPAQYAGAVGNGYTEEQAARQLEGARLETEFRQGIAHCRTNTRLILSAALIAYSEGIKLPRMGKHAQAKFNKFGKPFGDWLKASGGLLKDYAL